MDLAQTAVDPLAMFYAMRVAHMEKIGDTCKIWTTDGKSTALAIGKVIAREKIRVYGRKYSTICIEADTKKLKGVFNKSKNASLKIWVTTDKKIPVKIKSKVIVGSFVAELKRRIRAKRIKKR